MSRGGAREGAGAPNKEVIRDKFYQVATTKDMRKKLKEVAKDISELLTSKDSSVFVDEILLKAMQEYKHKIIEQQRLDIKSNFDSSYTITNAEIKKTRMNNKLKELIEKEKDVLKEKNISYLDVYSLNNEFMIIKLNEMINLIKPVGKYETLDDYFESLDD